MGLGPCKGLIGGGMTENGSQGEGLMSWGLCNWLYCFEDSGF